MKAVVVGLGWLSLLCLPHHQPLVVLAAVGHDDGETLCSTVNVSDAASCQTWCGGHEDDHEDAAAGVVEEEENVPGEANFTYYTDHGVFEEDTVFYLEGWECTCPKSSSSEEEAKKCKLPYALPTCLAKGMADCSGTACADMCNQVMGVDTDASTVRKNRFLGHDLYSCEHHEGGGGNDHDRRRKLDGADHHGDDGDGGADGKDAVTICYCTADQDNADSSTIVCSDADLQADHPHPEPTPSAAFTIATRSAIFAVGVMMVMNQLV